MRRRRHLFPKTRQAILGAVLAHPDRAWYLADLARHLQLTPSTLQRELATLCETGVLKRYRDGNRVYYAPDAECPFMSELRGLIVKTGGFVDVLRRALEPLRPRIELAFFYGSIARGEQRSSSDVDLMIIGQATLRELAPALRQAEQEFGRQVNAVVYSADEWAKRKRRQNPFVSQVLRSEKILIVGTCDELAAVAG